jgi:ribonucleoside-diphosphate reductase alpha chain
MPISTTHEEFTYKMESSEANFAIKNAQSIHMTSPGKLNVVKRNGKLDSYEANKIETALKKAFIAVEGENAAASERVRNLIRQVSEAITQTLLDRAQKKGGTVHIEEIQDQVEIHLMRSGEYPVFRAYILYREERKKARSQDSLKQEDSDVRTIKLEDGKIVPLNIRLLHQIVEEACEGIAEADPNFIVEDTLRNIFDEIPIKELQTGLILSARNLVEKEPTYTFVAARLLLHNLYHEVLPFLGMEDIRLRKEMDEKYGECFKHYIKKGVELDKLNPELETFDLEMLGKAIKPEQDLKFRYLGLQTLYDRYFIHHKGIRFELPQIFFMRVAMGLALAEKKEDREKYAIAFYQLLSSFDFMSSTPTLFNSGTLRSQLSSCFLTTVPDDLHEIYGAIRDNALLSKYAGGLGNDWTPVRAMGGYIAGTNGQSQGVIPFLKVVNDTAVAVNQGGKRKGAVCVYLETWHMDIEDFLDLRKNTGEERRRTHDINTANWIPDLFMKRVFEKGDWTLFSPEEVPELHDLYGEAFEKAYIEREQQAKAGEIRSKTVSAGNLWRKMLNMLFETGHPWMTFKDPCNLRSPQQHIGVVHSSNLCTEITLNTSKDEVAVCNLGSINLAQHMTEKGLDTQKLKQTIKTAIRMLDNVIDVNFYTIPQTQNSNYKHRPIGLGLMGFQDALYIQKMPYASEKAVEFADHSMETISYYAIEASCELAKERGVYESYEGSLWSQGILPIDSIEKLRATRGQYLEQDQTNTLNWEALREQVKKTGVRNSNIMAIAPTATISNICGVSQSIEPTYQNLFVKSNLSGEFTVINTYLAEDLKQLGLWDEVMVNDLKYYNGSIQNIERIPDTLKILYKTAFEIEPKWLVDSASRRQKWIDQAQSLNLYIAEPSGKKLDILYRMAWLRGLKTTYYLRSLGATSTEKSTVQDNRLNAVQQNTAPQACSIDDPDCEACQ